MMPSPIRKENVMGTKRSFKRLTAQELTGFMKKHGVSSKELSEILGVTEQAVRNWENGEREFSVTNSRLISIFDRYPQLIKEF